MTVTRESQGDLILQLSGVSLQRGIFGDFQVRIPNDGNYCVIIERKIDIFQVTL